MRVRSEGEVKRVFGSGADERSTEVRVRVNVKRVFGSGAGARSTANRSKKVFVFGFFFTTAVRY